MTQTTRPLDADHPALIAEVLYEVTRWPSGSPDPDALNFQPRSSRLRTYAYEGNGELPVARPAFRFRVAATPVDNIQIFDPLVFCRFGPIP